MFWTRILFLVLILLLWPGFSWAGYESLPRSSTEMPAEEEPAASKPGKNFLQGKTIDFFPVPIFETRPDEGQSYGLMPIFLFSDKKTDAIQVILAALGQYNSITKISGGALAYYYPDPYHRPDEVLEFYFELAQRYFRETTLRYFNPRFQDDFYLEAKFQWLKTPFRRFYGYGAGTVKSNESNYTSRNFLFHVTAGHYLSRYFRLNFAEHFLTTDLLTRAFPAVADTLTRYGALPGVNDSTHFIHELSASFDTRRNGDNSQKGIFIEAGYFFSHRSLGSDSIFHGFRAEGTLLKPWFQARTVTAARLALRDLYGSGVPFYLQSSLGGDQELRSFIPARFVDNGRWIFMLEQRIKVFGARIFGIPVELHADPFFELGRVFDNFKNFSFSSLQPVGGLGLRGIVRPNIVGRLDIAMGREGYNVYTMLGYPF